MDYADLVHQMVYTDLFYLIGHDNWFCLMGYVDWFFPVGFVLGKWCLFEATTKWSFVHLSNYATEISRQDKNEQGETSVPKSI